MTVLLLLPLLILAPALAAHALWRWFSLRRPAIHRTGRVTLVMPLTGPAPGLEALIAAFAAQTLAPRRLVIGIESEADPAAARVRALAATAPFPVEIRFGGPAERCGQKNANLIAAFAAIDAEDDAVVMCDADIRPQGWWLSAAATPALAGTHDVVTGFRWQLLEGRGLAGHLVAWLDRMAATLIAPPRFGLVWGGTVGLSRRALAVLDLPRLLADVLVDDLTIGQAARQRGLRIMSRGALTVPTPSEGSALGQVRFMRRQLQIVRVCNPRGWAAVMLVFHLLAGSWIAAALLLPDQLALVALLLAAACGLLRVLAQRRIGALVGVQDPPAGTAAQAMLGALPVLPDLLACALGWTMLRSRRMRWRHVEYEITGVNRVRVVARAG